MKRMWFIPQLDEKPKCQICNVNESIGIVGCCPVHGKWCCLDCASKEANIPAEKLKELIDTHITQLVTDIRRASNFRNN